MKRSGMPRPAWTAPLTAAALAVLALPATAEPLTVGLSGMVGTLSMVGRPLGTDRLVDSRPEYELTLNIEGNTDAGLSYGAILSLYAPEQESKEYRTALFLAHEWGRLEIGETDGPAGLLGIAAPGVGLRQIDNPTSRFIDYPVYLKARDTEWLPKISYYIPEFQGFQLGIAYAPGIGRDRRGQRALDAGTMGDLLARGFTGPTWITTAAPLSDAWEIAVAWTGAVGPVEIAASAAHTRARTGTLDIAGDADVPTGAAAQASFRRVRTLDFGLAASYAGVTVGGAYFLEGGSARMSRIRGTLFDPEDDDLTAVDQTVPRGPYGRGWNAGIAYQGEFWAVAASVAKLSTLPSANVRAVGVGGELELAPGLMLMADALRFRGGPEYGTLMLLGMRLYF